MKKTKYEEVVERKGAIVERSHTSCLAKFCCFDHVTYCASYKSTDRGRSVGGFIDDAKKMCSQIGFAMKADAKNGSSLSEANYKHSKNYVLSQKRTIFQFVVEKEIECWVFFYVCITLSPSSCIPPEFFAEYFL